MAKIHRMIMESEFPGQSTSTYGAIMTRKVSKNFVGRFIRVVLTICSKSLKFAEKIMIVTTSCFLKNVQSNVQCIVSITSIHEFNFYLNFFKIFLRMR